MSDNYKTPWWLSHWLWMSGLGGIVYLLTLLFQSLGWYPR
jgi:hypothetical protein